MRLILAIAFASFLVAPAAASAEQQIVVKRVPGLDRAERLAVRRHADVKLVDTLTVADAEVVRPEGDVDDTLRALNANPDVVYAEVDAPVALLTTDQYFGALYGLLNTGQTDYYGQTGTPGADIDATLAWTKSTGAGATVGIVDTGILTTHPDLDGQVTGNPGERGDGHETNGIDDDGNGFVDDWQGWDFANDDNTPDTEAEAHGTHVAGTIAALADNGIGVAGVAPAAKIVPIKVLGTGTSTASMLAEAFDYAGKLGLPVVNASVGGPGQAEIVTDAIKAHPNTLYVVAAGNDGVDAANTYPCNADAANVVCVGASDNRDQPAWFSNYSGTYVDLFAPGVDILSTYLLNDYAWSDGTSMAAPHVAGAAALLAAYRPGSTSAQIKLALLSSADVTRTLTGAAVTSGRLNANAALDALLGPPGPSPTPPVATPTPTPPPVVTPPPVATPAPVAVVQALKFSGKVSKRSKAHVTYRVSAAAKVTITLTRARCKAKKGCSAVVRRWSESANGSRTFTLGRKVRRRTLSPGRYKLTVATAASARSVTFTVR